MTYTVTLPELRKAKACISGYNKLVRALQGNPFTEADADRKTHIRFARKEPISIVSIIESNGLEDAIWAFRCVANANRDLRLFAVWCARQVQHLMTDPRSIKALEVAERHANGQATDAELAAARAAAGEAARAAAGEAAWDVAWDVARAAAWEVAREAAREAARDVAWDVARAAQKAMLIKMCHREAPWQVNGA